MKKDNNKFLIKYMLEILFYIIMLTGVLAGCMEKDMHETGIESTSIDNHIDINGLEGLWIYDSTTSYEFQNNYTGTMYVNKDAYPFSFELKKNRIMIDFENDDLYDCEYEFTLENETLILEGKEGTSGGVYKLIKQRVTNK